MKVSERALRADIFGERETLTESLREIFRELEKDFKREHLGIQESGLQREVGNWKE